MVNSVPGCLPCGMDLAAQVCQVLLGMGQPRAATWSWHRMCSAHGISIHGKCPPTPRALLFSQRKTCQGQGGSSRNSPTNLPPGRLWYHEHTETKHQIQSNVTILKKLKTFSEGSYITDQQLTKFLYKENKCCPVFLSRV